MNDTHSIEFQPSGRGKAQCPSNPDYPNGIALDITNGEEEGCMVEIPYPAPECGLYVIRCNLCDTSVALTAAGRADDPTSIKMRCRIFAVAEVQ